MMTLHGEKTIEKTVSKSEDIWAVLNLNLIFLVGFMLLWFALWSNFVATGEYRENLLKLKFSELEKQNNELLSQKSDANNVGSLLVFSKDAGLVEQKNVEYIFGGKDVAQSQ